ncbi:hypothetical protein BHM03_00024898, partial [Ensete ventricosum]
MPLVHQYGDGRSLIIMNHVSEVTLEARTNASYRVVCIGPLVDRCADLSLLGGTTEIDYQRSISIGISRGREKEEKGEEEGETWFPRALLFPGSPVLSVARAIRCPRAIPSPHAGEGT